MLFLDAFLHVLLPASAIALLYLLGLRIGLRVRPRSKATLLHHLFSLVLTATVATLLLNFYVYHGFGYQPDLMRHGSRTKPWVALTFDDGPSEKYTLQILAILAEYNVPATFFLLGANVEAHPEVAQAIVAQGHEIGNHTYNHINIPTTSTVRIYQELERTNQTIMATTGLRPTFVRPPRGLYDSRFRRIAATLGNHVVLWSLSSRDWRTPAPVSVIVNRIVGNVKAGDILLFHDNGSLLRIENGNRTATVDALPAVIAGVRAKGLQFVPLSQLLAGVPGEENVPALAEQE